MIFDFFKNINYGGEEVIDLNRNYREYVKRIARNYHIVDYVVVGDPTTEILADMLYGDSSLFWLLIYLNDITDPWHGWVKSQDAVYESAIQKYENNGGVEQIAFHMNQQFEVFYDLVEYPKGSQTWFHKGDTTFRYPQYNGHLQPVTVFEAEEIHNDRKRKIKIIQSKDIDRFLTDLSNEIKRINRSEGNV